MESNGLNDVWEAVCDNIKTYDNIDATQIDAFFSRLHPEALSDGFLMLTSETEFIKKYIERNYITTIKQSLKDLFGIEYSVEIEVDEPKGTIIPSVNIPKQTIQTNISSTTTSKPEVDSIVSAIPQPAEQLRARIELEPVAQPVRVMAEPEPEPKPEPRKAEGLASSLTFETFVIGDSNRLAYSMAVSVAEMPGRPNLNPLFIYGKSGLGKTHLLRAIQNYVLETNPTAKAIYIDSAEFLSEYASASAEHDKNKTSFQNFQNRFLNADVLLIDDVQYFMGKSATLDMVFQFFNKLTSIPKLTEVVDSHFSKLLAMAPIYNAEFKAFPNTALVVLYTDMYS